jgi:hypothetical protein
MGGNVRKRSAQGVAAVAALVVLAGCGPGAEREQGADDVAAADTVPADTVPSDTLPADTMPAQRIVRPQPADDFEAQPRLADLRERTPPDLGWEPGTTPWRSARREVPESVTQQAARAGGGGAEPGDALVLLASALGLPAELGGEGVTEMTLRVRRTGEDEAEGMLLFWGAADDSIAGSDLRVELRAVDGRWYVRSMEERVHCRRGVSGELCV